MGAIVVLVEDEADLRHALAVRLKSAGFAVETATNGQEALEMIARVRPAVVVTDLLMPVMDGHELVCRLKADVHTARIPVVVVTALPEPARAKWADDLAHTHIITKPFDSAVLLATIREVLAHPTQEGAHA